MSKVPEFSLDNIASEVEKLFPDANLREVCVHRNAFDGVVIEDYSGELAGVDVSGDSLLIGTDKALKAYQRAADRLALALDIEIEVAMEWRFTGRGVEREMPYGFSMRAIVEEFKIDGEPEPLHAWTEAERGQDWWESPDLDDEFDDEVYNDE